MIAGPVHTPPSKGVARSTERQRLGGGRAQQHTPSRLDPSCDFRSSMQRTHALECEFPHLGNRVIGGRNPIHRTNP